MFNPKWVEGKTIARVEMNPFSDGRGGTATFPEITFADGSRISFRVQETDTGDYGIGVVYVKPSRRHRPTPPSNPPPPSAYYVYLYRGGRDPDSCLYVVTEEVFHRLSPHQEELQEGRIPAEVQSDIDALFDLPNVVQKFTDVEFSELADQPHFLNVWLC